MTRRSKKKRKVGLPPGSLIHIGEVKIEKSKVQVFNYNEKTLTEKEIGSVDEVARLRSPGSICWVNVYGLHEVQVLERLGALFQLHPLVLEDILNTDQRPKTEDYNDYLYVVLKMLSFNDERGEIEEEQMSVVLGRGFVLSFQEKEGDIFGPIRDRLRNDKGRIRSQGADYLGYALTDAIVDSYFTVLERLGERIDILEEQLVENPTPASLRELHTMKREMIQLRRSVWPLREVISGLEKGSSNLIQPSTRLFLRDVYDHTIQVIDQVETFRDILSGMLDIYLSSSSIRLNEVMKVLTIISTIFIPLTFLAGVYGMNFKNLPELGWRYGYFMLWGVMLTVVGVMLLFFRRKHWF